VLRIDVANSKKGKSMFGPRKKRFGGYSGDETKEKLDLSNPPSGGSAVMPPIQQGVPFAEKQFELLSTYEPRFIRVGNTFINLDQVSYIRDGYFYFSNGHFVKIFIPDKTLEILERMCVK